MSEYTDYLKNRLHKAAGRSAFDPTLEALRKFLKGKPDRYLPEALESAAASAGSTPLKTPGPTNAPLSLSRKRK